LSIASSKVDENPHEVEMSREFHQNQAPIQIFFDLERHHVSFAAL